LSSHLGEGEELKKALRRSWEIEDWKRENCYRPEYIHCRECCSGGKMLGSMCEEAVMIEKEGVK